MKIAMLGTRGVPPMYGGFETAVYEVGRRLAKMGHAVTVYGRHPHAGRQPRRLLSVADVDGMRAIGLPAVNTKQMETLTRTMFATGHAIRDRPDVAFLFNAANAPCLPLLRARRVPTAVHIDGLEWQRSKWGRVGRRYYKLAELTSIRWSDAVIADARGIQTYVSSAYEAESVFIPYGAPLVDASPDQLERLGLLPHGYHLVVARFEPENHVREIIEGFTSSSARHPLVVVGEAPHGASYRRIIQEYARRDRRIVLTGGIWDQELLDTLYSFCLTYTHGHSVGGTNPSLLRAMGAGAPVIAYDVVFNREVAAQFADYFASPADLPALFEASELDPAGAHERGALGQGWALSKYSWDSVAEEYESLAWSLYRGKPLID